MGQILDKNVSYGHYYDAIKNPGTTPDIIKPVGNHDPQEGFEKRRKTRVSPMTTAEHDSCRLDFFERDFCALPYVKFMKCRRDNVPFVYRCRKYKEDWMECQYGDHIIRTKEYERERRLNIRDKALAMAQAEAEAAQKAAEAATDNANNASSSKR